MSAEEYLRATVGKFVFVVKKGYLYAEQGMWLTVEDGLARVGITDFLQQRSGDVAFVNVLETGTELTRGEELTGASLRRSLGSSIRGMKNWMSRLSWSIRIRTALVGWS
jgi:hypothetical protein